MDVKKIQDQLNGKLHWDASEREIREWLKKEHRIEGEEAETMIAVGMRNKSGTVRKRSLTNLVISLVIATILGILAVVAFMGGRRLRGYGYILLSATLGVLGYSGTQIANLASGKTDKAIDA